MVWFTLYRLNQVIEMLKAMDGSGIKADLQNQPERKDYGNAMAVATLWTVTMGNDEQRQLQETLKDKGIADDEVQQKSELKNNNRNRRLL